MIKNVIKMLVYIYILKDCKNICGRGVFPLPPFLLNDLFLAFCRHSVHVGPGVRTGSFWILAYAEEKGYDSSR